MPFFFFQNLIRSYSYYTCALSGNEIGSGEAQTKLIINKKLDEGIVEASFVYGGGEVDPIVLPRLQSFPNSVSVNTQFLWSKIPFILQAF